MMKIAKTLLLSAFLVVTAIEPAFAVSRPVRPPIPSHHDIEAAQGTYDSAVSLHTVDCVYNIFPTIESGLCSAYRSGGLGQLAVWLVAPDRRFCFMGACMGNWDHIAIHAKDKSRFFMDEVNRKIIENVQMEADYQDALDEHEHDMELYNSWLKLMPAGKVAFFDTDTSESEIAGNVIITRAADETEVTDYVLYWGYDDGATYGAPILTFDKSGDLIYRIAEDTPIPGSATHFIVLTKNALGEMHYGVRVQIDDATIEKRFSLLVNSDGVLRAQTDIPGADGYTIDKYVNSSEEGFQYIANGPIDRDGIFEVSLTDSGVFRARLQVNGVSVWEQNVFVQNDLGLTQEQIAALATDYAPIIVFNDNEEYFPTTLGYIFNKEEPSPRLDTHTMTIRPANGKCLSEKKTVPYGILADYLANNGCSHFLVDIPWFGENYPVFRDRKGSLTNVSIYYSYSEDLSANKFYLHYHLLYAYDNGGGKHIFDRESITLAFASGEFVPTEVVYGAHLVGQSMSLLGRVGDNEVTDIQEWRNGRVRVSWDDALKHNGHLVAVVTQGSHAMYPVPGTYRVGPSIENAGGSAYFSNTGAWNNIVFPQQLDNQNTLGYTLLALDAGNITSDAWNGAIGFSGFLVDVKGPTDARFPPFTDREMAPGEYVEGAYIWDSNAIPEYAQQCIDSLMSYISSVQ